MKTVKNWLKQLFRSPDGDASIKRILGMLCVLSLIVAMFISGYYITIKFDPNLISSVTSIAIICICGTVAEKFSPQISKLFDKITAKNEQVEQQISEEVK